VPVRRIRFSSLNPVEVRLIQGHLRGDNPMENMDDSVPTPISFPGSFRLFDLPSELRLRIYEYALAPSGVMFLMRTPSKRRAVEPAPTVELLASCSRIYNEAYGLLFSDNEIGITIDAHDTCWPTISEDRLPQAVLERVEHLFVLLDCTDYFNASYADVDWAAFSAMVSLKSIRITMVHRKISPQQRLTALLIAELKEFNVVAQILERIPATAKVTYGTTEGSPQRNVVWQVVNARARAVGGTVVEATSEDLETAERECKDLVRGCLSSCGDDVYKAGRARKVGSLPARM